MKRWICLFFLVWLGVPVLTFANTLTPNDFAYGLKIRVPAGVAVAAISMPEPVYKRVYRKDFGDIRIFNAGGEPVPHLLRYARSQRSQNSWSPLTYFPIPDRSDGTIPDYGVYVRTGPDGTIVRIQPQARRDSPASARTIIIDLSQMNMNLAELRLDWQPESLNRMVFLSVDASDNLIDWTRLQSRTVISDIHYNGHRLGNNTIHVPPTRKPYLRLRQLDKGPAIAIRSIKGRSIAEGPNPVRAFLTINGRQVDEAKAGGYMYDTGGVFPVDRVNLAFDQPNSMADAVLASRHHQQGEWRNRFSGLFYRIDVEGTALTSVPQPVTTTMDRYWHLTVNDSDSTIGRSIPRLEIGYRPHDLFFIARGRGPFTLAFGSTRADPLRTHVATLVDSIHQQHDQGVERWVFPDGAVFELGGARRLTPQPNPPPTRQIVLWSVLLGGVLIVALMAWRLACRLKP